MKKYTAPLFSGRFISLMSSWSYCKDAFAADFEDLKSSGAFLESGPGEKIWETKSKYVLKLPVSEGFAAVYKGYRRISKGMSYLLRPSPCGMEAMNYRRIASLGIPLPEFLAAGEKRSFFVLKDAFFITRFAEGFQDGRVFLPGGTMEHEGQVKKEFLHRHLRFLARCHDGGILHRGFTPANIMWKKRSAPDADGCMLDLLWIDLASCRRLPLFILNARCAEDLSLCLSPLKLPPEELDELVEAYCSARQKKAPSGLKIRARIR